VKVLRNSGYLACWRLATRGCEPAGNPLLSCGGRTGSAHVTIGDGPCWQRSSGPAIAYGTQVWAQSPLILQPVITEPGWEPGTPPPRTRSAICVRSPIAARWCRPTCARLVDHEPHRAGCATRSNQRLPIAVSGYRDGRSSAEGGVAASGARSRADARAILGHRDLSLGAWVRK